MTESPNALTPPDGMRTGPGGRGRGGVEDGGVGTRTAVELDWLGVGRTDEVAGRLGRERRAGGIDTAGGTAVGVGVAAEFGGADGADGASAVASAAGPVRDRPALDGEPERSQAVSVLAATTTASVIAATAARRAAVSRAAGRRAGAAGRTGADTTGRAFLLARRAARRREARRSQMLACHGSRQSRPQGQAGKARS
jgi:hypothetical protein